MKYDLKSPCKNCPFRCDSTRIQFSCRERAEEIEEQAYRHGFPCHLSAEYVEDEDTFDEESGGYYAGENSQHCVGYIIMKVKEQLDTCWPGIDNDEELYDRLAARVNLKAPVFEDTEAFLAANEKGAAR